MNKIKAVTDSQAYRTTALTLTRLFLVASLITGIVSFTGVIPEKILAYTSIGLGAGCFIMNLLQGQFTKKRAKQIVFFTSCGLTLIGLGIAGVFDHLPWQATSVGMIVAGAISTLTIMGQGAYWYYKRRQRQRSIFII